MYKNLSIALVLFAGVVLGSCSEGYSGPAVQQIRMHDLPEPISKYLQDGPSSASASSAAAAAPTAYYGNKGSYGYDAAPAYKQAPINNYAPLPSYGAPSAPAYGSSYGHYDSYAPKLTVQPAWAGQLYPGPVQYKSYQAPPQYNTVSLKVLPGEQVSTVYEPQQKKYSYPSGY